jgi:hypothetical protein
VEVAGFGFVVAAVVVVVGMVVVAGVVALV